MSKQQVAQKYIFKIHTDRLKKSKWHLKLALSEARDNDEVISIGDSQMLRWIDELNGITGSEERVREIRSEIKALRRRENALHYRRRIRDLYNELDAIQFKPDYMHLVVDRNKDFLRACKGFTINDVKYVRLLGTSGGVKNSTVVFVSERLAPVLRSRIDNGRNKEIPLVPAKLEAYRALTCSGSIPVSMPKGVLVVDDCITHFKEDVLYLTDENDGEPELREWNGFEVELNASDGCGMMLPSLAERWSEELRLGYTASALNTRQSWEKGVVFTFDFIEFADKVAGTRMVKDAWGNDVDIGNVELVLTTSMLKLWNCYDGVEHYLSCCEANHYTFGIAKTAPRELENRRAANYQFLQCLKMTDEQIDRLIAPTVNEIKDIIDCDYRKALLFMAGTNLTDENISRQTDIVKAIMIEPAMYDDPFIRQKIKRAIKKKIDDAKIGVIDLHANYSIIGGDLYALCQSIFGMNITGLLRPGEIYNKYWHDCGSKSVVCFRAPMSTAENVRPMSVGGREDVTHWFRYITTCTIMNCWDTCTAALNGCDFDGDILYITDDPVVLEVAPHLKTLYCAQKSAQKKIVTEEDLIQSNIDGFGNEVGKVTNRVTSMYDVQAQFEPGSIEYEMLAYRIRSGQQFQQNTIDKTKGIVCKPMPKYWYDYHSIVSAENSADGSDMNEINKRIVASKKPYFMRYVYPQIMKEYNNYMKRVNINSIANFRIELNELLATPADARSKEENVFVDYCERLIPVGMHDCTMNRICMRIESMFDRAKNTNGSHKFDYSIMKSGYKYDQHTYYTLKKTYDEHKKKLTDIAALDSERVSSKGSILDYRSTMIERFCRKVSIACNNRKEACDIILDMCYKKNNTKQFAWDVIADAILENLLERNGHQMSYPVKDPDGDIEYRGEKYSMARMVVNDEGNSVE